MKIGVMGSCRVQSSLRQYKRLHDNSIELYLFFPLMHTIEQARQTVDILQKRQKEETDVFDMRWGPAQFTEITDKNRQGKKIDIDDIDIFVIELCGVRNYYCEEHNLYLHPFPSYYEKHKKYKTIYSSNISFQLQLIYNRLKKPIVFVSNHNTMNKPSRTQMIEYLEQFAHTRSKIAFWNPTPLIMKKGKSRCLKNQNHFTDYFKVLQAQNILKKIEEIT